MKARATIVTQRDVRHSMTFHRSAEDDGWCDAAHRS